MIGVVYKVECNVTGLIYYGSTIQKLNVRVNKHRYNCNLYHANNNPRIYCTSFKVFENNNYNVELIENVEFDNISELKARERFYITEYQCVNKNIPFSSRTETTKRWKTNNKDKVKLYRENNKEREKEYRKTYRENNKEKLKLYKENNKEKQKEYSRLYYEKIRMKINEYDKIQNLLKNEIKLT